MTTLTGEQSQRKEPRHAAPMDILVALLMLSVTSYGAAYARLAPYEKQAFGATTAVIILIAAYRLLAIRGRRRIKRNICLWTAAVLLSVVPALTQHTVHARHILGDVFTLLLPAAMYVIALTSSRVYSGRWILIFIFILASVAMLAPIVTVQYDARSFQPPRPFLVAAVWILPFVRKGLVRWCALGLIAVMLPLAFFSGERFSVVFWIFCAVALVGSKKERMVYVTFGMAVVVLICFALGALPNLSIVSGSRFSTLSLSVESDMSLFLRTREVIDCWDTFLSEGGIVNALVGFGSGSSFEPREIVPYMNMFYQERVVTGDWRVHNIHFGPAAILFRYGIAGLVAYCVFAAMILKDFFRVISRGFVHASLWYDSIFVLAMVGYLLMFFLYRVETDLVFGWVVGGYLGMRALRPHVTARVMTKRVLVQSAYNRTLQGAVSEVFVSRLDNRFSDGRR